MIVKGRNVHVNMQRRQLELIASVISKIPADVDVSRDLYRNHVCRSPCKGAGEP